MSICKPVELGPCGQPASPAVFTRMLPLENPQDHSSSALFLQPPDSCCDFSEPLRGLLTLRSLQGIYSHWGMPAAYQREGPSSLAPDMKASPAIGGNLLAFDGHCRAGTALGLKNFTSHILP